MIEQSPLGFGLLEKKIVLKSGLDEFLNLNHIYVLNNFYVEKLSETEIKQLLSNDKEIISLLIKNTYKDVLTYTNGSHERFKINYTFSTNINSYSYNDELVLGIYYGSNTQNYNSKEKYLDNYKQKQIFMKDFSKMLTKEIFDKLDISAKLIIKKY